MRTIEGSAYRAIIEGWEKAWRIWMLDRELNMDPLLSAAAGRYVKIGDPFPPELVC